MSMNTMSLVMRLVVFTLFLSLTTGCGSVFIAGGPSLDSGTIEVSGTETGVGGQGEIGFMKESTGEGFAAYLSAGVLGYESPGDADPILLAQLEGRYRGILGSSSGAARLYYALGAGGGVLAVAGPRAGVITLHGELGVELGNGPVLVTLGLRERPALLIGSSTDFLNSLQLYLGLGFGAAR